ncbi:DEAD/DEAH box helicase [Spongorhabdus nitratireducens]
MIPGLLAQDIARSLREFIVTGFETDTWPFAGKFDALVNKHNNGEAFIKGPYVSIGLPFLKKTDRNDLFDGFKTEHSPFAHQQQAWSNLSSLGKYKSTIVATGTGSGKTECFLYPLLDHCQRHRKPGIKAIVIYPMNALATDQAKRFASVIHNTPELKGNIRAGLFIGGAEETDQKIMGPEQVITCKTTLRKNPPDILLTNYKMLDYLLMRPKDQPLWENNDPDTLRYLVVDELHTFDGAQGADLGMLIRRLKARLDVPKNHLVCAGTSATLGSEDQMDDLARFAGDIFDTSFDKHSIIGESREAHGKFLDVMDFSLLLNPAFTPEKLNPRHYDNPDEYLDAQAKLFLGDEHGLDIRSVSGRQALGKRLKQNPYLHNLLQYLDKNGISSLSSLITVVKSRIPANLKHHAAEVLLSLLSLMAHARGSNYGSEPFVTIRIQLWARELRRIVARLGDDSSGTPVSLQYSDDIKIGNDEIYLPLVQCNECHSTAWLARQEENSSHIEQDLRSIYNAFFQQDKSVRIYLPLQQGKQHFTVQGYERYICTGCGHLQPENGKCLSCNQGSLVHIFQPDLNKNVNRGGIPRIQSQRNCPVCQASNSLLLFGARAASLSAVAIHQLYASPINDDKKLIAFSDSVQDAAHRAGFFAARTWQNNLRMALAKTIHRQDKPVRFTDFVQTFPGLWRENPDNPDSFSTRDYITQFIAPNLQTSESWIELRDKNQLKNPDQLLDLINKRLGWEFCLEFGLRSTIGRSLQRTGVATLGWDPELITNAALTLKADAYEQLGIDIETRQAAFMLWGIAIRMKRQGAIAMPLVQPYIESGGNWYRLSHIQLPFMPVIGSHFTLPRFPAEAAESNLDPLQPKNSQGWYNRWATLFLDPDKLVDSGAVKKLSQLALEALTEGGLTLKLETQKGNTAWGLNPEQLYIYRDLISLRLSRQGSENDEGQNQCEGSWVAPDVWLPHIHGMPDIDIKGADGRQLPVFTEDLSPKHSFYRDYYLSGQIHRVQAHEHTSLLEREFRESLETRFINSQHTWDTNLLSATPTLEMGIDIGDLSSVLLCSVPPTQANYLQRAGRGGRKDGNSFVLTLANGHPHDLFFYANPLNMIAGNVEAPAIFLNASMVLRRQLLAFCFDQWGTHQGGLQEIPGSMQAVMDAVQHSRTGKFPYTLLDFISRNRDILWDRFEQLLDKKVSKNCRERLQAIMLGTSNDDEPLDIYFLTAVKRIVDLRHNLNEHQKSLKAELKKLEKMPKDESVSAQIREVGNEFEGIKRLKSELNRKETFNFFTDEGLLPNYAFPEEGTTLHSVIYRKLSTPRQNDDGSVTTFESRSYEYTRPAQAALSELAPESVFYASNKKVQIQRIEMAKGKNLQYWRLCPNCSYSEEITGPEQPACPRCEDSMWADSAQKREMVRLQQVYANTSEEDAQIGDESDTREPVFFNRQMLIDFEPEAVLLAHALDSDNISFGFEFIRKATFREINFGKQGAADQVFYVAGQEMPRPGFRICRECGTVQHHKNKPEHLFKCQYRNTEGQEGIIDCLYLYREYNSEAIRILMPHLLSRPRDEQTESFVAALQLGLKKRFGGKVDHIHITLSDEPIPGSAERASYLVLYDSVPGGTGYLHELLATPENLLEVLQLALQTLDSCSCQEQPEMDGCYNCLYAYKNSYGMERTSRKTAIELLNFVLSNNPVLKEVNNLGSIKKDPWADSELEACFPDAIQMLNNHPSIEHARVRISKDIINGKVGFRLEVGDFNYSVEIHPQLNEKHGVAYPCEPDFMIYPDKSSSGHLPVAVFLDGWKYHKDIIQEDLLKRQGLTLSGKYHCWSLTWHDVQQVFAGTETKIPNPLTEHTENSPSGPIQQIAQAQGLTNLQQLASLKPLAQLLNYLKQPDFTKWQKFAALRVLSWFDARSMQHPDGIARFRTLSGVWPSQFTECWQDVGFRLTSFTNFSECSDSLQLCAAADLAVVRDLDIKQLAVTTIYNAPDTDNQDAFSAWQRLLQLLNLLQFLPFSFISTQQGIDSGKYSELAWGETPAESVHTSGWDDVASIADEEALPFIHEISKHAIEKPAVSYEHLNDKGKVVAEAELAWPSRTTVLLLDYQLDENKDYFDKIGWNVITIDTEMDDLIEMVGIQ